MRNRHHHVETEARLSECMRLYAELQALVRLLRAKERALMAALGRLDPAVPAAAVLPGLERIAGEPGIRGSPPSG